MVPGIDDTFRFFLAGLCCYNMIFFLKFLTFRFHVLGVSEFCCLFCFL